VSRDTGSASLWVLAAAVVVFALAAAATVRTTAVLARHRAETAADLAALAAASDIGVTPDVCPAAGAVAVANGAQLVRCRADLAPDGRSGTVLATVRFVAHLPVAGTRTVLATARAGRDPPCGQNGASCR
jgi:secretion/DNA translocation related TadE-like protein